MAADLSLDAVCRSVADGTSIDWQALDSAELDQDARELLEELQIVADIVGAHRLLDVPASGDARPEPRASECGSGTEPRRWGRYDLVQELGRGTFGRVFRAWDPDLERFIAIKLIHPNGRVKNGLNDGVLREGRAIARINHPNVVSVYGVEVHDGRVGLCMELVNGKTLDEIVQTQGTLGAEEATMIGQSVCRALSAVHAANLVHRDVKARNVMRAEGGRIVLMDFGAGQALREETDRRPSAPQGTPIYMAPEALAGASGSIATDIYSAGVLMYFLVSASYPVVGATIDEVGQAHARGQRRLVTDHRPDLPGPFVKAVEKALDPDPQRRQESASRLLLELMDTAEQIRPEPGPSPAQQLRTFVAGNVAPAGSIGIAILFGLVLLGFVNSFAYSFALGFDSSLDAEGPLDWLRWGAKSMVAPLVLMIGVSVPVLLCSEVVALVRRVSSAVDRRCRGTGAAVADLVGRIGVTPSAALTVVLLACSLVFDWWVTKWRFPELLNATLTPIESASSDMLSRLAPTNYDEHTAYRQVLSLGVLAMAFGLFKVAGMASRRGERLRPLLMGAAVAPAMFALVLLDLPYRILWHNDGESVSYATASCHVIQARGDSLRLFCGSRIPRSIVVSSDDPDLVKSGTLESMFTPFSRAAIR